MSHTITAPQAFMSRCQALLLAVAMCALPGLAQAAPPAKAAPVATKPQIDRLNLNRASPQELTERLVGVGPKKAEAIVAWRKANKGFKTPAQLMEVKGIGPALYERNKAILSTR
ncbi:competence protein ComEA [Paraperlucidibaca baekdonensis]|uniref:Competence protein ComEA n=2 Tax=Paraperlucidibaca baekdonensis TaxID=748120 RepID=A0A3E0H2R6_9GAMM|nr:competence protein ComEA [Paraperlucidibaca baekdonensis]